MSVCVHAKLSAGENKAEKHLAVFFGADQRDIVIARIFIPDERKTGIEQSLRTDPSDSLRFG